MADSSADQVVMYDPARVPIDFGIPNQGATCWFAAAAQAIASMPCVVRWLELAIAADKAAGGPDPASAAAAGQALRQTMFDMVAPFTPEHRQHGHAPAHARPRPLMAALDRALGFCQRGAIPMSSGNQDAAEGVVLFMEALDIGLPAGGPPLAAFMMHDTVGWVVCGQCRKSTARRPATALHQELWDYEPCGGSPEENSAHFAKAVHRQSSVTEDFVCEGCRRPGPACRFTKLVRIREGFVVMLDQYTRRGQDMRLPARFTVPIRLAGRDARAVYRLVATVEHSGSMTVGSAARSGGSGGHYWAVALRTDTERGDELAVLPMVLNDGSTKKAGAGMATSPGTYVAFYHIAAVEQP